MKVAIVAPSPVPFTRGGAERAVSGIEHAINELSPHQAEVIKVPVDESTLAGTLAGYEAFANLDLDHFDRIIATKYPAWMVDHPHKTVYLFHPLRGFYDTWHTFGLPDAVPQPADHTFAMLHLMRQAHHRGALDEFFERWHNAVAAMGADHPDFAFPGPFARLCVRWLDAVATAPSEVAQYLAISGTVARRPDYFPARSNPTVVHLPGSLPAATRREQPDPYLFTASRLDGPKRIELLIDALAHIPDPIELRIAGTGPASADLRARATSDPRISFLGFVPEEELPQLYADALAVPFVPADEDLGLVTLEAFSQGTPVVTCTDSGGPTEFVRDGVNGLVTTPDPAAIAAALRRLIGNPERARQFGEAGRVVAGQVTWDSVVDGLLGVDARRPDDQVAAPAPTSRSSRRRVVALTTFPIGDGGHGGQIRARNLYGALAHRRPVDVVALVEHGNRRDWQSLTPTLSQLVVPRSIQHHRAGEELSSEVRLPVTDVVAGSHIHLTPAYLEAVAEAVDGASAVILAEPYLLPVIEQLEVDLPVVYDAYNVEALLKAGTYPDTPLGRDLLQQVIDVERRAVFRSDRTTTCSPIDSLGLIEATGLPAEHFTVIPNGTAVPERLISREARATQGSRWRHRYWTAGSTGAEPEHLAVFFGSWHPPNIDAVELLIEAATELPTTLILSVGFHGQAFLNRVVPPNLVFPGIVSTRAKDRLLQIADVALNPMRLGSGTNLKLLEYLAVGVPVVSTPFGARGIDVVDGRHLRFAEPDRFAAVVAEVLAEPDAAQDRAVAAHTLVRDRYTWDSLGADLAGVVTDIVPSEARK